MSAQAPTENLVDDVDGDLDLELRERLARLDLPAKVRLLTGADFWSLHADEGIGLRRMVLSDGPAGVRGEVWDERQPSLNLPSGTALGATWDDDVARRYGSVLGGEARAKGVHVLLGPTINLHRSPYGGRHFEALSEDPLLTARLAAAYVDGVQAHGVAACPKHYVANDYEVERHTASSEVGERALREVYLAAFEQAVVESGVWAVMSAYNSVNGTTMSEHPLLRDPLKTSWGFDGVVVSDWIAVKTTEASANAAQDLVMPAILSPWEDALVKAVEDGRVAEEAIDEKVLRLLLLASRVGALEGFPAVQASDGSGEDAPEALTELAAEGMVLLSNDGVLPWHSPGSVAVIGPSARVVRTQGGGSATVQPAHVVSPLDGIRAKFPEADVSFAMGIEAPTGVFPLERGRMFDPVAGEPGLHATLIDTTGEVLVDEVRHSSELTWLGTLPETAGTLVMRTTYTPGESERCMVGVACAGAVTVDIDGVPVIDAYEEVDVADFARAIFAPPVTAVPVELTAGVPIDLVVTCDLTRAPFPLIHSATLGLAPHAGSAEEMLAEAVAAAEAAEVAVVVVGTSAQTESEGFDRTTLALPGDQDRLVEAVAAVNPRTVVVVNAGSPVLMPWRDRVAAVVIGWFGGQQMGTALAEVLAGDREPGGRLPTTWPADEAGVPVGPDVPREGKVHYDEGIHVGHRGWLRAGHEPAYWFGHGLGYTTWEVTGVTHPQRIEVGDGVEIDVDLVNTGDRGGKHVVQVYLARDESTVERPARWLAGYAVARLAAEERRTVRVTVPARAFAAWTADGWWVEPGAFTVQVGTSSGEIVRSSDIEIVAP